MGAHPLRVECVIQILNPGPCNVQAEARLSATIPQRIEPKTFFANERTFLSWLHMAVTIGSIGAALLGFSGSAPRNPHASTTVRNANLTLYYSLSVVRHIHNPKLQPVLAAGLRLWQRTPRPARLHHGAQSSPLSALSSAQHLAVCC
jgi:uncharacterized membrane protein YidH (DUF202 family)